MRTVLFAVVVSFVGCGGGGNGGGGDDDDTPTDGSNPTDGQNPTPDGPAATIGIGSTCTPDQANPQGTCPAGFTCLSLQDGTNPWCSKTCATGAGDMCGVDYTGPGKASCVYQITPVGGGTAENFCGVVCQDMTPNNQICPAATCNGMCPGTLVCTAPLTGNNMTVANACQ